MSRMLITKLSTTLWFLHLPIQVLTDLDSNKTMDSDVELNFTEEEEAALEERLNESMGQLKTMQFLNRARALIRKEVEADASDEFIKSATTEGMGCITEQVETQAIHQEESSQKDEGRKWVRDERGVCPTCHKCPTCGRRTKEG